MIQLYGLSSVICGWRFYRARIEVLATSLQLGLLLHCIVLQAVGHQHLFMFQYGPPAFRLHERRVPKAVVLGLAIFINQYIDMALPLGNETTKQMVGARARANLF